MVCFTTKIYTRVLTKECKKKPCISESSRSRCGDEARSRFRQHRVDSGGADLQKLLVKKLV